jgi:hypothetical protein
MKKTSTAIENRIDRAAGIPAMGTIGRTARGFVAGALTPFRLISGIKGIFSALSEDATEECSARITATILSAVFTLAPGWKWMWMPLLATNAADWYCLVEARKGAREQP